MMQAPASQGGITLGHTWWGNGILLPLRIAARELRGGLRGFYVLIACIGLGVMAIAGVSSVASGLADGLAHEGSVILGGDLSFSLSLREASAAELEFLRERGDLSLAATLRAMARTPDGCAALVEVKAVDASYPLYGTATITPAQSLADVLAQHDGAFGAAADPALLARLDLPPGGRVAIGSAMIEIRATLQSEPDKLAGGIGFGPRLLVSAAARAQFPQAGWEIRSRVNASPSLEQNVQRFTQYLTLVGLTALLIGGAGVANAVKAHLDRRWEVIATLKSLGATGSQVFAIYLFQVVALAALGAVPGLLIGAAATFLIAWGFGAVLPLPLEPALHPGGLALAFLYGLLTAVAFGLWPLGRAHDVPVSALFRDAVSGDWRAPPRRYIAAMVLTAGALAGLAVALAYDRRTAVIFVAAAAGAFVLLRVVAALLMLAARRMPQPRSPVIRLAIANIHRPGALTPSIVLSLGLGLTLLCTVIAIDGNLRRQFLAAIPEQAPSFYFIDIPASDAEKFDAFIAAQAPGATLHRVPMLRGRIVAANGVPAESLKPPPDAAWALRSDRGVTYAQDLPAGSRLVAGQWWKRDYQGPPLVSFEKRIADGLGLKLGDGVTVNVLGRNITATVANLRAVDWQSLGINFVMVFSPSTFRGAPNADIATLTYHGGSTRSEETALLKAVAQAFPAIAVMRVRDVLDTVATTVTNLVLAIRAASALTLIVAVLVLAGALAAGHQRRVYEAVILKTLGATRARLLCAYAVEYFALGLATAVLGVAAGSAAAAFVIVRIMNLPFLMLPEPLLACSACAIVATVLLGLIGTFRALGQRPAPVLRNL